MTNSKIVSKKVLIAVAVIVSAAITLTVLGVSQAIATVQNQQLPNAAFPGFYGQMPRITGSVDAGQITNNFIKDNLKITFSQASETAAKQIVNGTIVGGHIGVVQGYLVYTFFVINPQNHTGHLTIVDAGNGHVLYTSQGLPMNSFSPPIFVGFGPWGMNRFGGFWHGSPFGHFD